MKVDIKHENILTRKYPYLGIFDNGEIVLFTAIDAGLSFTTNDWDDHWDENKAIVFRGTVTLSND